MKKKKLYTAPAVTITQMAADRHLLAGSQSPWAESKDNTSGWEDDTDDATDTYDTGAWGDISVEELW